MSAPEFAPPSAPYSAPDEAPDLPPPPVKIGAVHALNSGLRDRIKTGSLEGNERSMMHMEMSFNDKAIFPERDAAVLRWLSYLLKVPLQPDRLGDTLESGILLLQFLREVINVPKDRFSNISGFKKMIKKAKKNGYIRTQKKRAKATEVFKTKDRIKLYLLLCNEMGMGPADVFDTGDFDQFQTSHHKRILNHFENFEGRILDKKLKHYIPVGPIYSVEEVSQLWSRVSFNKKGTLELAPAPEPDHKAEEAAAAKKAAEDMAAKEAEEKAAKAAEAAAAEKVAKDRAAKEAEEKAAKEAEEKAAKEAEEKAAKEAEEQAAKEVLQSRGESDRGETAAMVAEAAEAEQAARAAKEAEDKAVKEATAAKEAEDQEAKEAEATTAKAKVKPEDSEEKLATESASNAVAGKQGRNVLRSDKSKRSKRGCCGCFS